MFDLRVLRRGPLDFIHHLPRPSRFRNLTEKRPSAPCALEAVAFRVALNDGWGDRLGSLWIPQQGLENPIGDSACMRALGNGQRLVLADEAMRIASVLQRNDNDCSRHRES